MHSATQSATQRVNDSDILQILLRLSDHQSTNVDYWEPQFPFLDHPTVCRVAQSVTETFSRGRNDLKNHLVRLLRKWCTGKNISDDLTHCAWIGRSLTVQECVESMISVGLPILMNGKDWVKRDKEQQMALCYTMLGAATNSSGALHPQAGEMCALLVQQILKERNLETGHHRFLSQIWSCVGELPIKLDILVEMSERSFLGIEKTLLWFGRKAITNIESIPESFETIVGTFLLRVCSQSPLIFQKVCNLFTHMMEVSQAHPGIQALIKSFVSSMELECTRQNQDICALYEESCQLVSALMCVDPTLLAEQGENVLSRGMVFQMLHELPRKKAACLLSHRPSWLLYTL